YLPAASPGTATKPDRTSPPAGTLSLHITPRPAASNRNSCVFDPIAVPAPTVVAENSAGAQSVMAYMSMSPTPSAPVIVATAPVPAVTCAPGGSTPASATSAQTWLRAEAAPQ